MSQRLRVRKTQKLFIAGAFARSESGRTFPYARDGQVLAIARGSRKDVRDAVRAARAAWAGWRDRSAYNRGQVLYRLAEIMETRRAQFVESASFSGTVPGAARREVDTAIDRAVWYAGWCDKIDQVLSTKNPVASQHFNVSSAEPTGVVGVIAPLRPGLLGLVSLIAPLLCAGNSVVIIASEQDPLSAVALAEALATSDVPPGVVNIITGRRDELVMPLASHMDVNALDLWIADKALDTRAAEAACDNVKRVRRSGEPPQRFWLSVRSQTPDWIRDFMEVKTVWHPAGV
ncbi:MAG: aldehyde dehydrogenase family protein [Candidatus Eremiobacteraeota bacterium]|nr:aldehyde dehydrogenase family protein [Candidatus Eremiobacteraeota bacterium]